MSMLGRVLLLLQVLLLVQLGASRPGRNRRSCPADAKEPWTYYGLNGPQYWGETYPDCYGEMQSPIAINLKDITRAPTLSRLALVNYNATLTRARIENNGHTVQIYPEDGVERKIQVEGEDYFLQQFHFHWGDVYYRGSEHTINGQAFSMEGHFVHMNSDNKIAVVGVFMQEAMRDNAGLKPIVDAFPEVQYKGDQSSLSSSLDLSRLIPSNPASFYRYEGSLTTPECAEGVSWSVLRRPITIGRSQIAKFRNLNSADSSEENADCKLINNYRPVQPLNGRQIFLSK